MIQDLPRVRRLPSPHAVAHQQCIRAGWRCERENSVASTRKIHAASWRSDDAKTLVRDERPSLPGPSRRAFGSHAKPRVSAYQPGGGFLRMVIMWFWITR